MRLATTFTPQGDGNPVLTYLYEAVFGKLATTFTPQGDGNNTNLIADSNSNYPLLATTFTPQGDGNPIISFFRGAIPNISHNLYPARGRKPR